MPHDYQSIPEFATRHAPSSLVRLPPGDDIPITDRVRRLIDTAAFRRLAQVSQLGLVRLIYPGAGHSRFEHSLGVYRVALDFLSRLATDTRFSKSVSSVEAEQFLVAALLHDVGHWPYCHPLEDIRLANLPDHESLARQAITTGEIAAALKEDWKLDPAAVADLIEGKSTTTGQRIAASMLSGPIDVDKIDYLARDSQGCGVPYGRNFDQPRLIASLCLNADGDRIAVTDKGKTAAELMVFARYVMFSEVYWHHAVRSGTAMLQRSVYELQDMLPWNELIHSTDHQFATLLQTVAHNTAVAPLVDGLFGDKRLLYKRLAQFSVLESPELYEQIARRPYDWLVGCSARLAAIIAKQARQSVAPHEVLLDAPPVELEVQFNVDVYHPKANLYRPLGEVSPVVRTLACEQFDRYVKRVRVFATPRIAKLLDTASLDAMLIQAAQSSD